MIYLLLLCAISLSSIAAWYAIAGLVAIFSAAAVPIMIMGAALEFAKLVIASWLYRNWSHLPKLMRAYVTASLIVLMCLTSVGIFGFLSKAHLDQVLPSGDVAAQIESMNDTIKMEQEKVASAKRELSILNTQIDKYNELNSISKGVRVRESQKAERQSLQDQITQSQAIISKTRQDMQPLSTQMRKLDAEVGPIKYLAAMIYGDNPNADLLEKSVRWFIMLIVAVFDPLAVVLFMGANWTLMNAHKLPKNTTKLFDWSSVMQNVRDLIKGGNMEPKWHKAKSVELLLEEFEKRLEKKADEIRKTRASNNLEDTKETIQEPVEYNYNEQPPVQTHYEAPAPVFLREVDDYIIPVQKPLQEAPMQSLDGVNNQEHDRVPVESYYEEDTQFTEPSDEDELPVFERTPWGNNKPKKRKN
mgnify:CR=1 FL=1